MKLNSLYTVLIAILLAIVVGTLTGTETTIFGINLFSIYKLFGDLFLNGLILVVVPLVVSSIISGINNIGKDKNLKKIGFKTLSVFIVTNLLAIIVGIIIVNLFKDTFLWSAQDIGSVKATSIPQDKLASIGGISDVILNIVPKNIFEALANSQMLGIIFFSLLFGYAITHIEGAPYEVVKNFFQGIFQCMIKITKLILIFLPFGVFFLVAKEFAQTGLSTLKSLGYYLMIVIVGMSIHFFITIPLLLKFIAKVNPLHMYKAMQKALVAGFSTCSSSATLPITLSNLHENVKVSSKISNLVAPLGCSINLSGSAMFVLISSSFIASAYGITLSLPIQLTIFLLTFLSTLGVAAVPSGCLITTALVLKGIGVPVEGIGLVIAVDRILDMFRTMVNVYSMSSSAVLVAKLEGEKNLLT